MRIVITAFLCVCSSWQILSWAFYVIYLDYTIFIYEIYGNHLIIDTLGVPLTGKIVPKAGKGKRNRARFDEVTTEEQMNPHSEIGSDESLAKQISLLSSRIDQLALKGE